MRYAYTKNVTIDGYNLTFDAAERHTQAISYIKAGDGTRQFPFQPQLEVTQDYDTDGASRKRVELTRVNPYDDFNENHPLVEVLEDLQTSYYLKSSGARVVELDVNGNKKSLSALGGLFITMIRTPLFALSIIVFIAVGCDLFFESNHPSDKTLETTFTSYKADFDKLISMAEEDRKVVRIAYDFTWLDSNYAWPRPESELGFSRDRWDQYRSLFKRLGIQKGMARPEDVDGGIFLVASAFGNVGGGSEKGYAFLPTPPVNVVDSLDAVPKVKEKTRVYKRLKDKWYLYYVWVG